VPPSLRLAKVVSDLTCTPRTDGLRTGCILGVRREARGIFWVCRSGRWPTRQIHQGTRVVRLCRVQGILSRASAVTSATFRHRCPRYTCNNTNTQGCTDLYTHSIRQEVRYLFVSEKQRHCFPSRHWPLADLVLALGGRQEMLQLPSLPGQLLTTQSALHLEWAGSAPVEQRLDTQRQTRGVWSVTGRPEARFRPCFRDDGILAGR